VSRSTRLVVLGLMGRIPYAGVAWQVLHYLEGFRRLGCEVYYVEDTGHWVHDSRQAVDYVARLMAWLGLCDRWAYRAADQGGRTFGLSETELACLFERAEALVSLSSPGTLRDEHLRVPTRIYLETDPVAPQIQAAQGDRWTIDLLEAHTHHFTFAENLGAPDCRVPLGRFDYQPTRQPVVLDWWAPSRSDAGNGHRPPSATERFTTISSWQQSGRDLEWQGETYTWSKHLEFLKFVELPERTRQPLELALACDDANVTQMLRSHGWRTVDALPVSSEILPYREYVQHSRGEFTVAKDQYARPRSGWFSDRSACYLAAGKPVVTQDTGFGNILPTGRGLFAFQTMDEILEAFEQIQGDYAAQARAAREIAEEHFAAERVLASVLERAGL
jgi:hypothetical protein